jgi:hypothetical protein
MGHHFGGMHLQSPENMISQKAGVLNFRLERVLVCNDRSFALADTVRKMADLGRIGLSYRGNRRRLIYAGSFLL